MTPIFRIRWAVFAAFLALLVARAAFSQQPPPAPQAPPSSPPGGLPSNPTTGATSHPAIAQMQSLIGQGRFSEAFDLGLRNKAQAGEPVFDYYFGIAAVDSGRASLGVLALERVLQASPGNDLARLELARAYFVLGDYGRAKEEFLALSGKEIAAPVRASIRHYLAAIERLK